LVITSNAQGTTCLTSHLDAWGGVQLASYPAATPVTGYIGVSFYAKTSSGVYNQLSMSLNTGSTTIMVTGNTRVYCMVISRTYNRMAKVLRSFH
jgi:hypothetical protein